MYDMNDRCVSVSLWSLAATLSWLTTATLVVGGALTNHDDLTQIGLAFSALSATLSMRGFCVRLGCQMDNAFNLGRDVGRAEGAEVRLLH